MTGYRTFTERVQARAAEAPGREALVLLTEHNGQLLPEQIAYAELDRAARSLAARLQTATAPGDRVVVLDSSRRLFATSFLACLYAGVVAVPAAPPGGRGHHDERVAGIVKDSTASCVLTSAREAAEVSQVLARTGYGHVTCLLADVATDHAELTEPDQGPDDIAFLQYTSGSTRDPRGAVVTHRNLLANLDAIGRTFRTPPGARLGGWLPFHHDMGLIGQLLYPLWLGGTAVLLSPLSFLKKPVRWLETISRYGLTLSGAPDFAYDLCVRGVTDEQLADLDLSCWQTAVNGGEPIRPETVQAFAERFAPAGLRPEALTPCYGLAEATLLVAAAKPEVPAARRTVDATALETHRLRPPRRGGPERTVAACGRAASCDLRIVDPITLEVLPDGRIGEIWVRGDSVVRGYWGRPAESSVTFGAQTADGRKGFLRTGDLGVVEEGLLYVTGRMKDVILVAGRNLYPQDLERTVQRVSSLFGSATAFGVPGEREHIVVVQELRARSRYDIDLDGLAAEVESRLAEEFEVQTGGVLLVRPGTVRKTTSGKVERGAMRELFLRGEIQPLHQRIGHDVARLLPGEPVMGGAEERIDALERAFGPLEDPGNPLGQDALLHADSLRTVLPEAEKVLDDHGFNAEFVPVEHGGRLDRLDVLGRVLRPVFRRDASLGFGYGLNCFFAATPVWTAGDHAQRELAARLLLEGRRLAVVRHEMGHGNDFHRDEFRAVPTGDGGYVLNGSKSVIANASRAAGLVVFALTDQDDAAGRSHSVLLLDRGRLPADRITGTGRHSTSGMRSAEFGGLQVTDCPVPAEALIGRPGDGYELSLRSSLVVRGLIPSIVLAGADTALRTVIRFAVRRRPDGRSSLDVRHVRSVLTGAFLDLLLSDCLALVATRALHLLPRQMSAYAAAAAYIAPKIITEAMDEMSAVLGGESFAEDGTYGMFQKQLRDLPVTSLGHAGSAGRQVSILPQLPFFARHAWFADPEPPPALFRPDGGLPPLDLAAPALLGDGDPLAATLVACTDRLETMAVSARHQDCLGALRFLVRRLTTELDELRTLFSRITPGDRAALASPRSFSLADRYTLVLAAAACLGVWQEQRDGTFLADPAWPTATLYRTCGRLGLPLPDRPEESERRVLAEALARLSGRRSYDLYGSALA